MYIEEVRAWSVTQKTLVSKKLCFLLPHEVVGVMSDAGDKEALVSTSGLDASNAARHRNILQKMETPFVSLSLWGDGVPFSWDRKHSVDIWTVSFPGLSEKVDRDIGVCLTAVPHQFMCREMQDDILAILSWSFSALCQGKYPTKRRDGSEWLPDDSWRKKRAGKELLQGILLEIKGDWKQLQGCFGVPGWMGKEDQPLCWRCQASKLSLKQEWGRDSSWLQPTQRLGHYQCLQRILSSEGQLSPVWSIPFMTTEALRIDWLHVADQA